MSRAVLLGVVFWMCLLAGSVLHAHEVRPAYLEISQSQADRYDIVWKQPTLGDIALHLVPHLSSGWLERQPEDQYAAAGFLIRSWNIHSEEPLAGLGRWDRTRGDVPHLPSATR